MVAKRSETYSTRSSASVSQSQSELASAMSRKRALPAPIRAAASRMLRSAMPAKPRKTTSAASSAGASQTSSLWPGCCGTQPTTASSTPVGESSRIRAVPAAVAGAPICTSCKLKSASICATNSGPRRLTKTRTDRGPGGSCRVEPACVSSGLTAATTTSPPASSNPVAGSGALSGAIGAARACAIRRTSGAPSTTKASASERAPSIWP